MGAGRGIVFWGKTKLTVICEECIRNAMQILLKEVTTATDSSKKVKRKDDKAFL